MVSLTEKEHRIALEFGLLSFSPRASWGPDQAALPVPHALCQDEEAEGQSEKGLSK